MKQDDFEKWRQIEVRDWWDGELWLLKSTDIERKEVEKKAGCSYGEEIPCKLVVTRLCTSEEHELYLLCVCVCVCCQADAEAVIALVAGL